jgi:glycosyltransferase involved in cell wall biosynthesis
VKLIVTIPAYNEEATIGTVIREVPRAIAGIDAVEVLVVDDGSRDGTVDAALEAGADYVVSHRRNRGLAAAFRTALREALARGADIIVNTDADNHYDQSRIPDLIAPLLRGEADIAVGSRLLDRLEMPAANKYGNRVANWIMQRLLGLDGVDVSSGFRAYTREAALKLNVLSSHTYTHETLVHALDQRMVVANVPLPARPVHRPSRLISSIPRHIWRAGIVILNSFVLYRPLQVWGALGLVFMLAGAVPFGRFLYFFAQGNGEGHIQSLIAGSVLIYFGVQMFVVGLLASAIGWNRRLIEETLQYLRATNGDGLTRLQMTRVLQARNGQGDRRKIHVA